MAADAGRWGPVATGGDGRQWPMRLLAVLLAGTVAYGAALASAGTRAVQAVGDNIEVVSVGGLDAVQEGNPLHVLVVGSDARDGLTDEQRRELTLGDFSGQRSDTVILASVSADRSDVSLVSMPRDTVVSDDDGGIAKLTETYGVGREELVRVVREDLGFPVNHYVEVSITGFIETVEVVGSVRVCLDEPLRDSKSGADFDEGCQRLDPAEALAYVRSRQGPLGDFERIGRQQTFLRALLAEIVSTRLLLDPGRIVSVAEEVSSNVTTDDQLSITDMARLAQDLQGALGNGIGMITVPGYTSPLSDAGTTKSFVIPYGPGLEALQEAIRAGEPLPSRGPEDERDEFTVGLWAQDIGLAGIVEGTLATAGFRPRPMGSGEVDAGARTVVYAAPLHEEEAAWVAAHLGTDVLPTPANVTLPEGVQVVVAVGDDADSFELPSS